MMSESCPNCGSERDDSYNPIIDVPSMDIRWHCGVYSFASGQIAHGETLACDLIRSLREELAEATAECAQLQKQRDNEMLARTTQVAYFRHMVGYFIGMLRKSKKQAWVYAESVELFLSSIQEARDAERDQIANWLEADNGTYDNPGTDYHDRYGPCLPERIERIRNNEHRSNT